MGDRVQTKNNTYCGSTFAVASSKTKIFFFRRMARAKQMSWRWPTLKLLPCAAISVSKPIALPVISFSSISCNALQISASENSPNGSKFLSKKWQGQYRLIGNSKFTKWKIDTYSLNEPENNTGSCGMIEICDRRSFNSILAVSIPSIRISPLTWAKRKMAPINDDLPAPSSATESTNSKSRQHEIEVYFEVLCLLMRESYA